MATTIQVSSSRGSTNSPQLMETNPSTTKESNTIAVEETIMSGDTATTAVDYHDNKSISSKKSVSSSSRKSISSVVRWSIFGGSGDGLTVDTRDEKSFNNNIDAQGSRGEGANESSNGREVDDEVRDENCPFTPTQVVSANIFTPSGRSETIDIIDRDLEEEEEQNNGGFKTPEEKEDAMSAYTELNPEYTSTMSTSLVADSILLAAEDAVPVVLPPSTSPTPPEALSVNERASTMQLIQDADYELDKFNEDVDTIMNAVVTELDKDSTALASASASADARSVKSNKSTKSVKSLLGALEEYTTRGGGRGVPTAAQDDDTIEDEQQQKLEDDKYSAAIADKYSTIAFETYVEEEKSSSINCKSEEEQLLQSLFKSLNFSVKKQNKLLSQYVGREDVLIVHLTRLHDEQVRKDDEDETLKKKKETTTTSPEKKGSFLTVSETPVVEAKQQQQSTATPKRRRMKSLSMKKLSLGMGPSTNKMNSPTHHLMSKHGITKKSQKAVPPTTTATTPTRSNFKKSKQTRSKTKSSLSAFMRKKQPAKEQIVSSERSIELAMAEQKLSNDQEDKSVQKALAKAQEEALPSQASLDEQKSDVSAHASAKSVSSKVEPTLKSVEVQLTKEVTDVIISSPSKEWVELGKVEDENKETVASDQSSSNASKVYDTGANVELSNAATNDEDEIKDKAATRDDKSSPTLENITKGLKEAFVGMFDKASLTTGPDNKPQDSNPEDDKPKNAEQTDIKEVSVSKNVSPVVEETDKSEKGLLKEAEDGGVREVEKEVEKVSSDDKEETPVELSQPEVATQEPAKVEPELPPLPSNVDVEPMPHESPKEDVCPESPDKTQAGVELSAQFDERRKGGPETCVKSAKPRSATPIDDDLDDEISVAQSYKTIKLTETEEVDVHKKNKKKNLNKAKSKEASALLRKLPTSSKSNGSPSTLTSLMEQDEDNALTEKEETHATDAEPVVVEESAVRKQKRSRILRFGFAKTRSESPAVSNPSIDNIPVVAGTTTTNNNKPEEAKKSKAEKDEEKKKTAKELEILAKLEAAEKKIMEYELQTEKTIEAQKRGELQAQKEEKKEQHAAKELDDVLQAMVSNDEHDVSLSQTDSSSLSHLARATSFGSTAMKKAKVAAAAKKEAIAAKKEASKAKLEQRIEEAKVAAAAKKEASKAKLEQRIEASKIKLEKKMEALKEKQELAAVKREIAKEKAAERKMYEKEVSQELATLRKEKRREMRNLMQKYDDEELEIMIEMVQKKFKKKERAVKRNRADEDSVLCDEMTEAMQDAARLEAEALAERAEAQRILDELQLAKKGARKKRLSEETRESVLSDCEEEEALFSVDGSMDDSTFMSNDRARKESEVGCGFGFDDIAMGILSCFGDPTEQTKACASTTWAEEESDVESEDESLTSTRSEREEKARKWKLARAREAKKNKMAKKSRRKREEC